MAPSRCSQNSVLVLGQVVAVGATLLLALAAAHDTAQETFDPDVDLNTPQTVRRYGYPAEAHVVQTADGYLLTVHRIPGPRFSNASEGPASAVPSEGTSGLSTLSGSPASATPDGTTATATTKDAWTTSSDETATNVTVAPSATATPPGSEITQLWASTETPVTNGTVTPWTTAAWTNSYETNATSDPTSTLLPENMTVTTQPVTTTSSPITYPSTINFNTTSAPDSTFTTTFTTIPTTYPPLPTTYPPPLLRPVIFLQHGLLGSSYDWIVAGPGKGLAYLLADAGYDVWMGNARGNTYSRAHVYLPTESSSPFWDFSFHEMGIYDLPAVIDYILNTTGAPQLHYVGHSMGTTMFFVMASTKPDVAAGVASMYALAPVVYVKHIKSPIRLLAPFARDVEFLAGLLGDGEFLPQNKILHYLAKYGCELLETEKDVCENLIFILCGYDKPQFDTNILPVLLSHTPAGASTRTLIHYAQMIKSGKFQQYDLGKYGNLKKYRSLVPPTYDLSKVNVSVHLVYANNDWLAAPMDVNTLYQDLHCTKTQYLVPLSSFNHLDFILAKDVKSLLYDKLLKEIPRDIDYRTYEDNFIYD